MRWRDREGSSNVIDQTGSGGARRGGRILGGGGVGTVVLVLVLYLMGVSPTEILSLFLSGESQRPPVTRNANDPVTQERKDFVKVVLRDTEVVWGDIFSQQGRQYQEPRLVLFGDSVQSACGLADLWRSFGPRPGR